MNLERVSVDFTSGFKLIGNKGILSSSLAALYAYKSHLRFQDKVLIKDNIQNALVLDCTILYIESVAEFLNNKGENPFSLVCYIYLYDVCLVLTRLV